MGMLVELFVGELEVEPVVFPGVVVVVVWTAIGAGEVVVVSVGAVVFVVGERMVVLVVRVG